MDNSAVSGMACSRARRVVPIPAQRSRTVIVLSGLAELSTGAEFHIEWGIVCQFFDPARVAGRQLLYALCRKVLGCCVIGDDRKRSAKHQVLPVSQCVNDGARFAFSSVRQRRSSGELGHQQIKSMVMSIQAVAMKVVGAQKGHVFFLRSGFGEVLDLAELLRCAPQLLVLDPDPNPVQFGAEEMALCTFQTYICSPAHLEKVFKVLEVSFLAG
eukprot:scaffold2635_cov443-Pavlova_lutheri.AAC.2